MHQSKWVTRRLISRIISWFPVGLLFVLSLAGCHPETAEPESMAPIAEDERPNIIFLLTDDQRADTLSIAGHPFSQTPNIDELARQGVRYTNAFTVEPICAPSRFAFLSGQYERTSGLGFNSPYQVSQSQWQATYPARLRDAGYDTGFIGKFGVQFYDFEGGAPAQFDYWKAHDGWLPFFPKDLKQNPATEIYQNAEHDITTEIMGEAIDEFLAKRNKNVPFSLSVSFSAPHNSLVSSMYPEGAADDCEDYACRVMGYPANNNPRLQDHPIYDELYRDSAIEISPDTGRDPYRFIPEGVIDHEARQKWYAYNYDASLQPEHLVRYHQAITGVDQIVGQLIAALKAEGIDDNTVIIFSSDHGLLNGEYGTGGKGLLYDLVTKIPLVVYDPRQTNRGVENRNLVLSIDVPATILTLAGIAPSTSMEGRALNDQQPPRDAVFLESLTVAEGNPFIEAVRTQDWKYVRYLEPSGCPYDESHLDFSDANVLYEQLFDLRDDPGERINLATESEHDAQLLALRARTEAFSIEQTRRGIAYKESQPVPLRPVEGSYCW